MTMKPFDDLKNTVTQLKNVDKFLAELQLVVTMNEVQQAELLVLLRKNLK